MVIKDLQPDDAIICTSLEENRKIRELISELTGEKETVCNNYEEVAFYWDGEGIEWSDIDYPITKGYKTYSAKLFINNNKIYEVW